jgi:hypothetical protein
MSIFGFGYYKCEKTAWKLVIGFVEIVAALASNYAQLGLLAKHGTQAAFYDRVTLFVGGVVVFSKGVKDVMEGWERYKQDKGETISAGQC